MMSLFYSPEIDDPDNQQFPIQQLACFFAEHNIFNNGHLDIVAPSPNNNNPNMSASFLIMAKLLFMNRT